MQLRCSARKAEFTFERHRLANWRALSSWHETLAADLLEQKLEQGRLDLIRTYIQYEVLVMNTEYSRLAVLQKRAFAVTCHVSSRGMKHEKEPRATIRLDTTRSEASSNDWRRRRPGLPQADTKPAIARMKARASIAQLALQLSTKSRVHRADAACAFARYVSAHAGTSSSCHARTEQSLEPLYRNRLPAARLLTSAVWPMSVAQSSNLGTSSLLA